MVMIASALEQSPSTWSSCQFPQATGATSGESITLDALSSIPKGMGTNFISHHPNQEPRHLKHHSVAFSDTT